MRMLHSDSVRELFFSDGLSMCGDPGSPDISELAHENLGIMEGDAFGESSIRRRARRAVQDEFIPVNEISEEDTLDQDFFSFDEEDEDESIENTDDSTPYYDYDEEEEEVSSVPQTITPEVQVFIKTNLDTGAVSVSTEEEEPMIESFGDISLLYDDYDLAEDDDCWMGPRDDYDDDVGCDAFRGDRFLDEGDVGYDYDYVDEWSRLLMLTDEPGRKERIRRMVWRMQEEESIHDPFEDTSMDAKMEPIRNDRDCDHGRTDGKHKKYISGRTIYQDGERPDRYKCFKSHELELTLESERMARAGMIKDWAANRQVFVNQHGWMYWCHPIGDSDGMVRSSRQSTRLTSEEYRFFTSLSREERNLYLHPKCRNHEWIGADYQKGRSVSRSNSWKYQCRQTRQWESPTMRRGGSKKVVQPTPAVEMETFDRVLGDRIAVLETQIEIEEAKMKPDVEMICEMKSDLRSLEWSSLYWGEKRDDILEIFWRIRNDGHVPMDVQKRIAEKYGDSGLIEFLVIAGVSRDEAYVMEDERSKAARRVA